MLPVKIEKEAVTIGVSERISTMLAESPRICQPVLMYPLQGEGKQARARLVELLGQESGLEPNKTLAIATVIEVLHTGTLLHDDVIDHAPMRRGRTAMWRAHGTDAAILTGDIYYMHAFAELARSGCASLSGPLAETLVRVGEGELIQRELRWNPNPMPAAVTMVAERKTGELFAWLASSVAQLTGGNVAAARQWGMRLGYGFQLADDLMDFVPMTEAENQAGKKRFTDLREGLVTLPMLQAMDTTPELADAIAQAFTHREDEPWRFGHVYRKLQTSGIEARIYQQMQSILQDLDDLAASWLPDPTAVRSFARAMLYRKG